MEERMEVMEKTMKLPRKKRDVNMTEGNIFRHLITFAFPLLLGNIFQQFYNMVDTWVVGNYVSNEAFSAVGTVGPIINMLIGSFMGFSSGAGVVISQYYGAKNEEKVHDAVHTAITLTVILSIVMTLIGVVITPVMLRLMKTPENVFPESKAYLTIYFSGMTGLLFYNMGAGILRAIGDSRRPFIFLVVSAITTLTGVPSAYRRFSSKSLAALFAIFIVCSSRDSRTFSTPRRPSMVGRMPMHGILP